VTDLTLFAFGSAIAAGGYDFNGDGVPDILVGVSAVHRTVLVSGRSFYNNKYTFTRTFDIPFGTWNIMNFQVQQIQDVANVFVSLIWTWTVRGPSNIMLSNQSRLRGVWWDYHITIW